MYVEALIKTGDRRKAEGVARTYGIDVGGLGAGVGGGVGGAGMRDGGVSGAGMHNSGEISGAGIRGAGIFGSREEPLHVVVTESPWMVFSRWVKWLVPVGLLRMAHTWDSISSWTTGQSSRIRPWRTRRWR